MCPHFSENQSTKASPPLTNRFGLYIHVPFCQHRCSYCDFYSLVDNASPPYRELLNAYLIELDSAVAQIALKRGRQKIQLNSIFLGGGTPSLMPLDLMSVLFDRITELFSFAPDIEITMEANPETVNEEFCKQLKQRTPVNRISMGAQSFQSRHLSTLERNCGVEEIKKATFLLKQFGIEHFNLDLIFAIPGQTQAESLNDIQVAASLNPEHISFYNLTLKPGHKLFNHLPNSDLCAEFYESGREQLESLGYYQYEISNFSKSNRESKHNLLYWDGGDYLGIGPSASSRFFSNRKFLHRKQLSSLDKYLEDPSFSWDQFDSSSGTQTQLEAVFLELRKNQGIDCQQFIHRYGWDPRGAKSYPDLVKEQLIVEGKNCLRLSDKGRLLADSVTLALSGS